MRGVRWATLNDASQDRYGFSEGRLMAQVAFYDGPGAWRAYVGGEPVEGYWSSRDEAERAAESAFGR